MSGFSADWLALREPADHRSRDRTLLAKLARHFADRESVIIADLGAGTGSNLRAIAPMLANRQTWMLFDHDAALLAAARGRIAEWAESAEGNDKKLEIAKGGKTLLIELHQADLAASPTPWRGTAPDLVTAAALFDLVSESWIARFTAALAKENALFYTALNHDDVAVWAPRHPADAEMTKAFERHFGSDKGFGPSAGSRASALIARDLAAASYRVEHGRSDWHLGAADRPLIVMLAGAWANAVGETRAVPAPTIAAWLAARKGADTSCVVRHEDLLAWPPR
jgi:hypothetical protein